MKTVNCFTFCIVLFLLSCTGNSNNSNAPNEDGTRIVKEYYGNGKVKTEISVKDSLRHGITKNYDSEGRLLSEVTYVNNVREGIAKNYYAESGKLNSTLEYRNGIKEGNEIWYYESGKEYRVSPFVNGNIEGIQKLYYEDGKLFAEVPFKGGFPGVGLKEYNEDGSLMNNYPKLIIEKQDYLKSANKVILSIRLSNNATSVKYYKGKLNDGYLNEKSILLASPNGIAHIDYNIPNGAVLKQNLVITCNYKTPHGNPCVISRDYYLEIDNSRR